MSKKPNGHDKNEDNDKGDAKGVVKFPTLAERDKMRRQKEEEKEAEDKKIRDQYLARQKAYKRMAQNYSKPSFFNFGRILPFTRFILFAYIAGFVPLAFIFPDYKAFAFMNFGFVPGYYTGLITGQLSSVPWGAALAPFSHVFLHGDVMHLMFNLVMTLVFGVFVENVFGTRRTVIFYFLCAALGAAFHLALSPYSAAPVVGASSAISGLFGAALIMIHEQGRMGFMPGRGPWPMIGIWVVIMVVLGLLTPGNVAWQAHLGGFLGGVILYQGLRAGRIRF